MKYNLLVWCVHSCRRDVFLQELEKGLLPNFEALIDRGLFMSSALVGGHYQKVSFHSEITGRPINSPVSPAENILNAAHRASAYVGVVNDGPIANWTGTCVEQGIVESKQDIIPNLIKYPGFINNEQPNIDFLPDSSHERWLYWYRARSTHRPFSNLAMAFRHDGGLLEEIANRDANLVIDQQRYGLRIQDRWLGTTMNHLEDAGRLDESAILIFSSHGSSLEGWIPLMGKVTTATVDHTSVNFHPNVTRSFAALIGPGIDSGRIDEWVSIMDLKPTLCEYLSVPDLGGSAYGLDLLNHRPDSDRILADVSSVSTYSLYGTSSGWLYIAIPAKNRPDWQDGLPPADQGFLAFNLFEDEVCARPRNQDFVDSGECPRFEQEANRLGLNFYKP